jgi:UDP:flavonoid glycosyltransferase YjiC (YdhE family)
MSARIVVTSYASYGDLNPLLAVVALRLQARGYQVVMAVHEQSRNTSNWLVLRAGHCLPAGSYRVLGQT